MTRDHAIKRAKQMRDGIVRMTKIAADQKLPFGERYKAVILAEDYEEAARRFDRFAERERAEGGR
jgi:hypothetical protein